MRLRLWRESEMSSFFGFAIVMLVIFLIIAFSIGLIRAVSRVFSFLTENETESINNQEKSKNKQQKNLLWLGIGVLLGISIFAE